MRPDDRTALAGVLAVSLCVGMVVAITTGGSPGPELVFTDERPAVTSAVPVGLPVLSVAGVPASPDGQLPRSGPRVRSTAVVAADPGTTAAPTATWVRPSTTRAPDPAPPLFVREPRPTPQPSTTTSTSQPPTTAPSSTIPPDSPPPSQSSTTATSNPDTGAEPGDDQTDTDTTAPADTTTSTSTPDGGDF